MDKLQYALQVAPVLLFSMVAHEYAHGYAALKQGDPTAFQLGRLTFNPLKHLDPFMSIILPMLLLWQGLPVLGGAKPIPVVPRNYRNYRRGDIIVSMAGIVVNLALAVLSTLLAVVFGMLGDALPAANETFAILQQVMRWGVWINLGLAIFNLMPIPPLDGSHVMKYVLPPSWALRYQQVGMYGILIIMIMLMTGLGNTVFSIWFLPLYALREVSEVLVRPFMLISNVLIPLP